MSSAPLTLSMLGENFSRRHFEIFLFCFQIIGFDISCKLSPRRQFAWNVEAYFSEKKKKMKNITNLSSAKFAERMVKTKACPTLLCTSIWAGTPIPRAFFSLGILTSGYSQIVFILCLIQGNERPGHILRMRRNFFSAYGIRGFFLMLRQISK